MSYAYSTIAAFALEDAKNECLRGYAAPSGAAPALVKLTADETPIAFARATGYSASASASGLRMGWCGFELHGLRQAFAISDDVKLRCGVSDEILATLSIDRLSATTPSAVQLSADDLAAMVREPDCCPGIDQLMPFALNHYRRHGARQFIEAAYQTLFGRWPDIDAPDLDKSFETDDEKIEFYILDIVESLEYKEKWKSTIPGPFMSGFTFDRTGII